MKRIRRVLLAVLLALPMVGAQLHAQTWDEEETLPRWNMKTNLLHDVTATISLGAPDTSGEGMKKITIPRAVILPELRPEDKTDQNKGLLMRIETSAWSIAGVVAPHAEASNYSIPRNSYLDISATGKNRELDISSNILDWGDGGIGESGFDGPYHFSVSPNELTLSSAGETKTFTVDTNHPDGWTATDDASWLTTEKVGANALYVTATTSNESTTAPRTAYVHITAGRITQKVKVTQEKRILWGGHADVLYFANGTIEVGRWGTDVTSIADLACFTFGSVVGFSNHENSSAIKFNPTMSNYAYGPQVYSSMDFNFQNSDGVYTKRNVSHPDYHNADNIALAKGDPCKLAGMDVSKKGEEGYLETYDSGWRLPTLQENRMFVGLTPTDTGSPGVGYYTVTGSWEYREDPPAINPGIGTFPKNLYAPGVSLPAVGLRGPSGKVNNSGSGGYYWSSDASDSFGGYLLSFNKSSVNPSGHDNIAAGANVRCVKDTPSLPSTYKVTLGTPALPGGTLTVSPSAATTSGVSAGTTVTLDLTPNSGYRLTGWTVTPASVTIPVAAPYKFTMPAADITVTPVYSQVSTLWGGHADILYFDANNNLAIGRWGEQITNINQMAWFKFGSVIGIKNPDSGTTWNNNQIVYNPSKYAVGTVNNGSTITGWGNESTTLPAVPGFQSTDYNNNFGPEIWSSDYHYGENIRRGKGDPCKLVGFDLSALIGTEEQKAALLEEYDSGWRLPTAQENARFVGGPSGGAWVNWKPGDDACKYTSTDGSIGATSFPYYRDNNGDPVTNTTGASATAPRVSHFPVVTDAFNEAYSQKLPAAGYRDFYTSAVSLAGTSGSYWSSTPHSGTFGYSLDVFSSTVYLVNPSYYPHGFSVRCVRP